ncbi:MAG: hypothetical protein ACWGHO_01100 [Candidatus Moraniibacteriota bacterium]
MKFKIMLLGSIPKGDDARKKWTDWKTDYKNILSQLDNVEFMDGDAWKDETKPFLLFGHDLNLVKAANIVIVNAEKEIGKGIGVGTAQEIMVAKYFLKPVITILPKNTHHRRSNIVFDGTLISDWISPFLLSTSDLVVETIHESLPWIKEYINSPESKKIKNISIIDDAIASYLKTYNSNKS